MKNRMIYVILLLTLLGCQHEQFNEIPNGKAGKEFFVSKSEAINVSLARPTAAMTRFYIHDKEIESCYAYCSEESTTTQFYAINYKGGGFVIISADKRIIPILASSDEDCFVLGEEYLMPEGLWVWMKNITCVIDSLRTNNITQDESVKSMWKSFTNISTRSDDDDDYDKDGPDDEVVTPVCQDPNYGFRETDAIVGPLLNSKWDQVNGYNSCIPKTCGTTNAPAGCVAVSLAQIMKYYKSPSIYNWNSMPDVYTTETTSHFLLEIGENVKINYDCDGSSASNDNALSALKNNYGYVTAKLADYNYNIVRNEVLNAKRPAILSGGSKGFLEVYKNGHSWICDGVEVMGSYRCVYDEELKDYYTLRIAEYLSLHMNWGWGGKNNGWYSFSDFHPTGNEHSYNYKTKMITSLIPTL